MNEYTYLDNVNLESDSERVGADALEDVLVHLSRR